MDVAICPVEIGLLLVTKTVQNGFVQNCKMSILRFQRRALLEIFQASTKCGARDSKDLRQIILCRSDLFPVFRKSKQASANTRPNRQCQGLRQQSDGLCGVSGGQIVKGKPVLRLILQQLFGVFT